MRLITALLLNGLFSTAYAAQPQAPAAQPVPPPPPMDANAPDADLEPPVTIIKQAEQTIEEYRANGKLYMIKVIPKIGSPYYLVDDRGDGKFSRQEGLDSGVRPPRWTIHKF